MLLAAGDLDPTFGVGGIVTTDVTGSQSVRDVAIQSDGKVIVAGNVYGGTSDDFALVRYNSDGSLDDGTASDTTPGDSFGIEGVVITDVAGGHDEIQAVALTSDGKIVVGGIAWNQAGGTWDDFALARYNSDGTIDTDFGVNGFVVTDIDSTRPYNRWTSHSDGVRDLVIQVDGKIIAVGSAGNSNPNWNDFALVRYNSDGSLDDGSASDTTPGDSFGTDGVVITDFEGRSDIAFTVALQPDGRIIAAGEVDTETGDWMGGLARYNPDGSPDGTFGTGGLVTVSNNQTVFDLHVLPDTTILAALHTGHTVAKFLPNGEPDSSFGGGDGIVGTGFGTSSSGSSQMSVQVDGKIVVAGGAIIAGNSDFALVRYNSDGSLDDGSASDSTPGDSFGTDGKVTTDTTGNHLNDAANTMLIQPDGNIVAAGISDSASWALARYEGDSPDTTPPVASGDFPNIKAVMDRPHMITVTYRDDVAIDVSTLDSSDIFVTGPNDYSEHATFVGVDIGTDGTSRTATYAVHPPGVKWNLTGNGLYTISILDGQVSDTRGNYIAAAELGQLNVDIRLPLTIIVHGWQPDGTFPAWVTDMERAIESRFVSEGMAWDEAQDNVIPYDWAHLSNNPGPGWVEAAGDELFALVMAELLSRGDPLNAVVPLHFIAHSRGSSVISEAIERLVSYGIPVSQMTLLDRARLNPAADPLAQVWTTNRDMLPVNVAWADNYIAGLDILGLFTDGELEGAYDQVLPEYYHWDTHDWYYMTITDTTSTKGFYWSLGGGGVLDRPDTKGQPTLQSEAIKAVFNGDFSYTLEDAANAGHERTAPGYEGSNYSIALTEAAVLKPRPDAYLEHKPTYVPPSAQYLTLDIQVPRQVSRARNNPTLNISFTRVESLSDTGKSQLELLSIPLHIQELTRLLPGRIYSLAIPLSAILQDKPYGTIGLFKFEYTTDVRSRSLDITIDNVTIDAFVQVINTRPWQNPLSSLDTNRDGSISAIDALLLINTLNMLGTRALPTPTSPLDLPKFYYDTNGDGFVSPIDALLVINWLNNPTSSAEGETAGELARPLHAGIARAETAVKPRRASLGATSADSAPGAQRPGRDSAQARASSVPLADAMTYQVTGSPVRVGFSQSAAAHTLRAGRDRHDLAQHIEALDDLLAGQDDRR